MNIYWLGKDAPPEGLDIKKVDSLYDVEKDSLLFIDDQSVFSWNEIQSGRVYLVSDLPISSPLPEQMAGVIPNDAMVIQAITTLFCEMRESYDIGDKLIRSLNEKELAIQEKQSILLRDSKRYKAIIKNATDLIFILGPAGKIMYCNETLLKYIEGHEASLIGVSFVKYVIDEDKDLIRDLIKRSFHNGVPAKITVRLHIADGKIGTFSLMSTPMAEDGHIYAMSVIGRDITDIRNMQQRLTVQARDLTSMINGLSHELRNPLTVIGAYIRRLDKDAGNKDNSKWGRAISGITSSIKRIEDMVLRIERYESLVNMNMHFSEICVEKLVKDALSSLKSPVPVSIRGAEDIWAYSDSGHIRIALLRILENAVQTNSTEIIINLSQDSGYTRISVRDFGPGVKDDFGDLCGPFYSSDPMKTGLGLTEARIAMVKIGGEIEMVKQANPGAVFTLKVLSDRRYRAREAD